MNNPNQTPSWRNSKRVDQSSSGSSFQATATPFIPRLAVTPNPGSFYQPTPQITHCGPEQPPSPYYPLESATFMPPDTPAGSALNSPGLGRPEEGVDYQYLGGSPRDNDTGGVSLSRERSATSPAREAPSAGWGEGGYEEDEDAAPGSYGHNRVISDLGPLPGRGFEQAMHSRRVLDEQSLWNQSWLTDPEKKWIETGRSRSNTTISPGTLANGQRRARSGSQSTVIAEPTPREKMLQSLNNVASLSTENPNAAQQKAYDTSNNQQELKANTGVRGSFQSLDPAMNKGPQNETSTTSRANARLGNQSSRLENVVEEGGMGSSIGDDPHPSSQNTRQNLGLGARVGNIVPRYVHSGPIENTPRQSASTANAYWDEMPDRNDNSNYDRAPPGMSAYQTGSNLGHIDSMGFQTHGSQNDNLSYSQTQPEHVSAFARARAATTPLSFSRDYESGTDLRHHYDARGEQEYKEYGVQAFRPRDRAYSVAHERSAEYSEQSAGEHAYMERAASSARLPEPQIKMGHTPSNRGLPTQGPYPAGNVTPFQQSLSLNQSPAGMRFLPPVQDRQIAHDYRQQAASSLRGQDDMSQLQYQDPRPLYREGLAVPPVNRQDHYLPYYNATNYGQPSPAAYSYGDHGLGHLNYRHPGHTQHDTEALSYGQNYYNPNQPSYNLGFDRQFQHQTGPERYPGTPSYPYQAAPQTRAASGYNDPRLHLQGQMPEYMHPSYIGAALPLGDPRNALYPGYGPLQNMESLQRSRQPTPERLRLQQFGAHQAYNVSSPSQQTLRSSAMHPVQQAKGGKPSMQHSRQPMYGNPIQKSPRSGYSGRMAVQQHPHVDVAPEPVPAAPTVPYRAGTDTMYPMSMGVLSSQYHDLTRNGRPSFEEASNKLPFIELARHVKPAEWGVLRIGNIPYSVTKQEILAFLGRNAKIITPDLGCAIHIIMERATGKTMDCFVEFLSSGDALAAVNRFVRQKEEGRSGRIGDRHVDVEMSGQDSLMKELFPRAKNVIWHGADPAIFQSTEPFNSGFKGFITSEEMVMTVKHAETPHRSPFSHKCLQRTYESMISVLAKYPWWAVESYTLADRDLLFRATEQLVRALVNQLVRGGTGNPQINEQLLTELVYAGLNAAGFSEMQRAQLVRSADGVGSRIRISPLASVWPFEVLGRKADTDEDVIEYFAACLRQATTSSALVSLAELSLSRASGTVASPFGNVTVPWPADKESMTMAAAAAVEWGVVESLLRKVLGDGVDASQA